MGGERGAELVANVGDEVAAGAFGGFDIGDVMEGRRRLLHRAWELALISKMLPGRSELARP